MNKKWWKAAGIRAIKKVAQTGVDIISMGALTHSVTAFDISLKITEPRLSYFRIVYR